MFKALLENQSAELLELVKTGPDPGPVPSRLFAFVVIDAIEIGSPTRPRLWGNVLQRPEQVVRNEYLGFPARYFGTRPLLAACDCGGCLRFPFAIVAVIVASSASISTYRPVSE